MKKLKKQQKNMIVAITVVIVIAIAIAFVMTASNNTNTNNTKDTAAVTKSKADAMKAQAIEAFSNNNISRAKTLFQQAQQKYKDIGDTNDVIDTAAQLYLIEHSSTTK